jgi:hypothetical protein
MCHSTVCCAVNRRVLFVSLKNSKNFTITDRMEDECIFFLRYNVCLRLCFLMTLGCVPFCFWHFFIHQRSTINTD